MKKIIALTACVVLLNCGLASAAAVSATGASITAEATSIYGGISTGDAEGTSSTLIGKLSKGVSLGAYYTSTAYALDTKHSSGNTRFGTAHDATAIYKQEIGSATLVAPTAASYTSFTTWTAM